MGLQARQCLDFLVSLSSSQLSGVVSVSSSLFTGPGRVSTSSSACLLLSSQGSSASRLGQAGSRVPLQLVFFSALRGRQRLVWARQGLEFLFSLSSLSYTGPFLQLPTCLSLNRAAIYTNNPDLRDWSDVTGVEPSWAMAHTSTFLKKCAAVTPKIYNYV